MANVEEMALHYRELGYSERNADARVCQDIFDFCYLKDHVEMERLKECIGSYILDEPTMREQNMDDIRRRVSRTFNNRQFRANVEGSGDRNWLQIDVEEAFSIINNFLNTIE